MKAKPWAYWALLFAWAMTTVSFGITFYTNRRLMAMNTQLFEKIERCEKYLDLTP